jgi:hypothetical protein
MPVTPDVFTTPAVTALLSFTTSAFRLFDIWDDFDRCRIPTIVHSRLIPRQIFKDNILLDVYCSLPAYQSRSLGGKAGSISPRIPTTIHVHPLLQDHTTYCTFHPMPGSTSHDRTVPHLRLVDRSSQSKPRVLGLSRNPKNPWYVSRGIIRRHSLIG